MKVRKRSHGEASHALHAPPKRRAKRRRNSKVGQAPAAAPARVVGLQQLDALPLSRIGSYLDLKALARLARVG